MKRELNTIITNKKIIRHLSKDNSYNPGKSKKLYSNTLDRKPSNYFLSSCKYINLKDKNKDNYKNKNKRKYSIRNPKINNTLNDIYNTINNINNLNRKIQKILYNPERLYKLNHSHTTYNKPNIIFLENYKHIELDKLNDIYDMDIDNDNSNNKIYMKTSISSHNYNIKEDYLRDKIKCMKYNKTDESSKENNINQIYINLKLNRNNNRNNLNRNRQFNRNNTNNIFNKYFKINDDEKIDDYEHINKIKGKEHKKYYYRNIKNSFRNKNYSLNTDLNIKNEEKIIDNLKNTKYKKFNMLEDKKIPFNNNSRFSEVKKDENKYSINNYYKTDDESLNYDYDTNSITIRRK